ncbi:MAG: YbaK/EbsC family protein [Clostridiales bacterium]|nr:YbaK/EbsC family protein [Clostridiales bacterium]
MAIDKVREYLKQFNMEGRVVEFPVSSATVELAAEAAGVIPARICKTLSFRSPEGCILVETAGDTKIDNRKFKDFFGFKASMLSPDEVFGYTGHEVGGVCAFGIERSDVKVYSDISMQRFDTVFPACGSSNSAIELTCEELHRVAKALEWIDVCKGWE